MSTHTRPKQHNNPMPAPHAASTYQNAHRYFATTSSPAAQRPRLVCGLFIFCSRALQPRASFGHIPGIHPTRWPRPPPPPPQTFPCFPAGFPGPEVHIWLPNILLREQTRRYELDDQHGTVTRHKLVLEPPRCLTNEHTRSPYGLGPMVRINTATRIWVRTKCSPSWCLPPWMEVATSRWPSYSYYKQPVGRSGIGRTRVDDAAHHPPPILPSVQEV